MWAFDRDNWAAWGAAAIVASTLLGILWSKVLKPVSVACYKVIRLVDLAEQHFFPTKDGEPSTFDQLIHSVADHERRITILESRPINPGGPPK